MNAIEAPGAGGGASGEAAVAVAAINEWRGTLQPPVAHCRCGSKEREDKAAAAVYAAVHTHAFSCVLTAWCAATPGSSLPKPQPHDGPKGSGAKAGNIKVCVRKRPLSASESAAVGRADERGRHEL